MKELRTLETSLDLPKPLRQYEVDSSFSTDSKGASHYERYAAHDYTDTYVFDMLRSKLIKTLGKNCRSHRRLAQMYLSSFKRSAVR